MPRQSTALLCCLQHCTGVEAVGSVSVGVGRGWAGNMASRRLRVLLPSSLVEQPEDKPWRCKDRLHVVALHSRGRHPQPSFTRSLRRVVDVDAVDVWVVWVVHEEHPRAIDRALVKGAERMPRYAAVVSVQCPRRGARGPRRHALLLLAAHLPEQCVPQLDVPEAELPPLFYQLFMRSRRQQLEWKGEAVFSHVRPREPGV
mmetsp:Transcript_27113/g.65471  ORF Transcript_27113/g.65471 Transcript_27113/m.65471 type:complete len:201 (-) Transcript_27113:666-1268(-)